MDFKTVIGDRIQKICKPLGVDIAYAYQELTDIPGNLPNGRKKPWGTGHAVLVCDGLIDSPFAVINADDYYGKYGFLAASKFLESGYYGLVGYQLKNTLSNNGSVTRGICSIEDGKLMRIAETKNIVKVKNGAEANGEPVDLAVLVSMNFWCYPLDFFEVLRKGFLSFLSNIKDPLKDEYLLPIIADEMLKDGVLFTVLPTEDKWFGVTYKEDKPTVVDGLKNLLKPVRIGLIYIQISICRDNYGV